MVLVHSAVLALHYIIYFTSKGTHMYHMLIKIQIIRLSNDIDNIKMGKRILLKIN